MKTLVSLTLYDTQQTSLHATHGRESTQSNALSATATKPIVDAKRSLCSIPSKVCQPYVEVIGAKFSLC